MRSFQPDREAKAADPQSSDPAGSPGKQTRVEQLDAQGAAPATTPASPNPAVERAERQLARPGYDYLAPFARPLIEEVRKPGSDPAKAVRLNQLFEVSKSDGGGELAPVKAASNAYHAQLGEQAIAELTARSPSGAAAEVRAEVASAGRSLAAKYKPLLEDDVQLSVQLGAITHGQQPSIAIDVSIAPNDSSWRLWLCCVGPLTQWLFRRGPAPAEQGGNRAATETTPLLTNAPPGQPPMVVPEPPLATDQAATGHGQAAQPQPPGPPVNAPAPSDGHPPDASASPTAKDFADRFDARGTPVAIPVDAKIDTLGNVGPSSGKAKVAAKQPGYVVNMASIPSEVQAGMASRYFSGAWAGTSDTEAAKARTAVVVGVNSFRGMDAAADAGKKNAIEAGIAKVTPGGADEKMAVFGYSWEPGWQVDPAPAPASEAASARPRRGPISLAEVRQQWLALPPGVRAEAATLMDSKVKSDLPYGFFRNQVLESEYTRRAVAAVGKVADPVHIVVQDADGGVAAPAKQDGTQPGILTAYDDVLRDLERHPLLTIGGYHFRGFQWEPGEQRTQRLTELSNEIDRAVRQAIATVYPAMLYPTEPNMLIKAQDAQHNDGVFDRGLQQPFGTGTAEGRTARTAILTADRDSDNRHPAPVHYAPSTSTMTSPVPDRLERGLTVPASPEYVAKAESGELSKERTGSSKPAEALPDHRKHATLVVEEQAQNTLSSRRLAYEFVRAFPVTDLASGEQLPSSAQSKTQTVFDEAGKTVQGVVDGRNQPGDGGGSSTSGAAVAPAPEGASSGKAKKVKKPAATKPPTPAERAVTRAREITAAIVAAMTTEQMRATLAELHGLLDEIKAEGAASLGQDSSEGDHGAP